jgi:alkylhydroperoxidase family enzyme
MSTTRIPAAPITGLYGALVKRFSIKMLGRVPEPLGVYFHNHAVLKSYLAVSTKAHKWHECDPSLKSFAHLAVASMLGCSWCLDFGYFEAFNAKLDLAKAREVPRWRESSVFTPLERDVMAYAEAMSVTPPMVTDELSASLRERIGAPALVELTAFIALANFYTRSNIAFGIESEGYAAACDLAPLAPRSEVASGA